MDQPQQHPNPSLAELLQRLEDRATEGLARVRLDGHAVSKSADSLHLAISSGLVAIPLSEVEDVFPIFGAPSPEWVSVVVRSADRIQYLRRIEESEESQADDIDGSVARGVVTVFCVDTATITGREGADATDDARCISFSDTTAPSRRPDLSA